MGLGSGSGSRAAASASAALSWLAAEARTSPRAWLGLG